MPSEKNIVGEKMTNLSFGTLSTGASKNVSWIEFNISEKSFT